MTPAERIQPYIVAAHRRSLGMTSESLDLGLVAADPELLSYARGEIQRLRTRGPNRTLAEDDHESKIRCEALERLVVMG